MFTQSLDSIVLWLFVTPKCFLTHSFCEKNADFTYILQYLHLIAIYGDYHNNKENKGSHG